MSVTTENVWEAFHIQLRQFILKRVPDETSADDILQDVFLKVHARIDTLRDEEKLPAWLYAITRHVITDYYREHKADAELPEISYEPEYPVEDVVRELAPSLKMMIESLPPEYREALILTEYEGLTQRELAERLGLSIPGAKSRVQRAREKLKKMLLECCHFEFDRLGRVINYSPRCVCCVEGCSCSA